MARYWQRTFDLLVPTLDRWINRHLGSHGRWRSGRGKNYIWVWVRMVWLLDSRMLNWLIGWLVDWLVCWLVDWLLCWSQVLKCPGVWFEIRRVAVTSIKITLLLGSVLLISFFCTRLLAESRTFAARLLQDTSNHPISCLCVCVCGVTEPQSHNISQKKIGPLKSSMTSLNWDRKK